MQYSMVLSIQAASEKLSNDSSQQYTDLQNATGSYTSTTIRVCRWQHLTVSRFASCTCEISYADDLSTTARVSVSLLYV